MAYSNQSMDQREDRKARSASGINLNRAFRTTTTLRSPPLQRSTLSFPNPYPFHPSLPGLLCRVSTATVSSRNKPATLQIHRRANRHQRRLRDKIFKHRLKVRNTDQSVGGSTGQLHWKGRGYSGHNLRCSTRVFKPPFVAMRS